MGHLVAVPLLGGLLGDAEQACDLRPRVAEDAQGVDRTLDVALDGRAAGDKGLQVGFCASHASRLVDAPMSRQDALTHQTEGI